MADLKNIFDVAARGMSAQMVRLNTVASNLANARSVASSEAEAYREEVVSRAQGDASRFDQVYTAYEMDKDVTRERIYIETIEEVFGNIEKIIIDEDGKSVVPYLPLKELGKARNAN